MRVRRAVGVLLVAAAVGAMVLAAVASGSEPAQPSTVSPEDGAHLAAAPERVSLLFTEGRPPREVHLGVTGPDGGSVTTSEESQDGQLVAVTVAGPGPGDYQVAYHAVLSDGTEVIGSSRFRVSAEGGSTVEAVQPPPAARHHQVADDPFNIGLLVLDVALLGGLALLFLLRRRRPAATGPGPGPGPGPGLDDPTGSAQETSRGSRVADAPR